MHGSCFKIVYLAWITLFRITFPINCWTSAEGTKYTMIRSYITVIFALLTVCSFCGKDFVALGRHQWRCKQRVHSNTAGPDGDINIPLVTDTVSPVRNIDVASIKCCCGKLCKGMKGLRIHQRSCRIVNNLGEEGSTIDESYCETKECPENHLSDHFELNPGIRVPRSDNEWLLANTFFQSAFVNVVVNESTVTDVVKLMSTTIYNYFKEACGTVGSCDKDLENKYKYFLVKDLKKQLKYLKSSNAPISEIKFVSSRA